MIRDPIAYLPLLPRVLLYKTLKIRKMYNWFRRKNKSEKTSKDGIWRVLATMQAQPSSIAQLSYRHTFSQR
jgi:hypothetical protein